MKSPNAKKTFTLTCTLLLTILLTQGCSRQSEARDMDNAKMTGDSPAQNTKADTSQYKQATFAAGCFWGVESTYQQLDGVITTAVGYTGGSVDKPSYEKVCSGKTGHAEAVKLVYDPSKISYPQLLDAFWNSHDPTTMNRQGPDVGTQYRSAIFFHDSEQQSLAESSKYDLQQSGRFPRDVVTEITVATTFHRAEEYHQKYLQKRGKESCRTP